MRTWGVVQAAGPGGIQQGPMPTYLMSLQILNFNNSMRQEDYDLGNRWTSDDIL